LLASVGIATAFLLLRPIIALFLLVQSIIVLVIKKWPSYSLREGETFGGLQYGIREILLLLFAVAYILGITKWLWWYSTYPYYYDRSSGFLVLYLLMFFSGGIFFLIGRSMRHMTPNRKLSRLTRRVMLAILFSTILVLFYDLWGIIHLQHQDIFYDIIEPGFPHGWPYPDKAYLNLCTWFGAHRSPRSPFPQVEYIQCAAQLTFLPILTSLFWCLGILLPIRKKPWAIS
jgi:hypothetical protein